MENNFKERFFKALLSTQSAKQRSGGRQVSVRCPFCGDSKNIKSSHMYVGFSQDENGNDSIPLYDCKKCPRAGKFTSEILRMLNIHDVSLDMELTKLLEKNKGKGTTKKYTSSRARTLILPEFDNKSDTHKKKLEYVKKRVDLFYVDFNKYENIKKFNIVYSIKELLTKNDIELSDTSISDERFLNVLENDYIGFLMHDHRSIYFRNTNPNSTSHYKIFLTKQKGGKSFYIVKNDIDLMAENPKIILTENVFDLINVTKMHDSNNRQNVLAAVNNKFYYKNAIMEIIDITGFYDATVYIYADNDDQVQQDLQTYKNLLSLFHNKVYICFNTNAKDYYSFTGVDLKYYTLN